MEQRSFGTTGLRVSALGFGCGAVGGLMVKGDPSEQRTAVQRALDAGVTYFDTAADYGSGRSEENLGRVMRELGTWSRVSVGTKFRLRSEDMGDPGAAIRRSLEASLTRLGRSDVDVFHLHNPIGLPNGSERVLPLDVVLGEVANGLQAVVDAGLVRHAGFTGLGDSGALREVVQSDPFRSVQAYFNMLDPSAGYAGHTGGSHDFEGLIDSAAREGCGVIVIRVLAAGAATASPAREANAGDPGTILGQDSYARDLQRAERLKALVKEYDLESSVELALRFGLSKPGVSTVLVGYSTLQHLEDAIRFTERGPLPVAAVEEVLGAALA
jgi:aryl-alcohol dehydrogenase-like predicted oxidoreductase